MSLSKRLRFEVFKRDRFTCQYCGRRPPDVMLEVDHIVPKVANGRDVPGNLTTSCFECNRGKGPVPLGAVSPALDEMGRLEAMQEMLERRRSLEDEIAVAEAAGEVESRAIAQVCTWWKDAYGPHAKLPDQGSIRKFVQRLTMEDLRDAVEVTRDRCRGDSRRALKFFYGVCWRKTKPVPA